MDLHTDTDTELKDYFSPNAGPLLWHIARCQPGQDYLSKEALKRRGYTVYRPTMPHKYRTRRNAEVPGSISIFPSYLFVLPSRSGWEALRTAPGMMYRENALLRLNGRCATIAHNDPQHIGIVQVRELEESLWTIDINGNQPIPRFKAGDQVQIKKGTWIEFCGTIETLDDNGRCSVLLNLLGRRVRAFVNSAHLVSASA